MIRLSLPPGRALLAAAIVSLCTLTAPFASAADKATPPAGKGPATGKAAPTAGAPQDAMMEAMMKFATPGPEHAVLNPLVGKWKGVTKMWMAPGDPTVSEGTVDRSWVMGGRYLVAKHTGEFGGMPFEGMEVLGYDKMHGMYVSTWIDNMGTGIGMSEGGVWDAAAKTLTVKMSFDDPVTGQKTAFRNVTKIVDDNTHVFSMIGVKDGKDFTQMETTYTRIP